MWQDGNCNDDDLLRVRNNPSLVFSAIDKHNVDIEARLPYCFETGRSGLLQ
jgi:hypothetical protein